ncbi:MAG: NAD(P)H-dependent oxidoreductase [Alphaproteobacteria bacterium]|nr:NAD(P)H-dependent oxidoreductase [Alphaproteobacteria bacterium]
MSKTLLIVHHSLTGGTAQMAAAAAEGAREEAVILRALRAAEAGPDDLLGADAMIFAAPENLASLAGVMKDLFDRCYYPCLGRLNGRPYAMMICAGSDGEGAARQIGRIALGWRLRAVAEPLIVMTHAQSEAAILAPKVIGVEDLARCRELGQALAAGLALGVF